MKFNSIRKRAGAFLLLLVMGQNIVMPTCMYALSGGPLQPEFTSFESIGSTDMVNLFTGDFTYSIPVLNVPGIDGGFSMPLSYHAGIGLEEEASWVGLGWNINPGAITRNVNNVPDDYSSQSINYTFSDPGGSGYSYVIPLLLGSYTYDSDKGAGGSIGYGAWLSIGLGTNAGKNTVLAVSEDGIDPVGVAAMAVDVFSFGTAGSTMSAAGEVLKTGLSLYNVVRTTNALTKGNQPYSIGDYKIEQKNRLFYRTYKYYLAKNIVQYFYGSLYLGDYDNIDYGTNASLLITKDNSSTIPNQGYLYKDNVIGDVSTTNKGVVAPGQINYDDFSVQGDGVSGSIQPYRLDIGSLNFKILDRPDLVKVALLPYTHASNYKVQFRYTSDPANNYTHPIGTGYGSSPISIDGPNQFGFQIVNSGSNWFYKQQDESINAPVPSTTEIVNKRVVTGRFINWFSNAEIATGIATANGFINYKFGDTRAGLPTTGIGGYSITRPDGYTYHYALPVYGKNQYISTKPKDGASGVTSGISDPSPYATTWLLTAITGPDFVDRGSTTGVIDQDDWGYWVKLDYGRFADNFGWSNPYDFNTQMIAGENNQAYSLATGARETYYLDKITTKTHTALFFKSLRKDGKGSHSAFYNNKGTPNPLDDTFDYSPGGNPPSSSLKLDDIVVLRNEDYAILTGPAYNLKFNLNSASENTVKAGDTFKNVIDVNDISENANATAINTFIIQNQIRKIHFEYDYILCPKTLNSFNIDRPTITYNVNSHGSHIETDNSFGKLALLSISSLGRSNSKLAPDYQFSYGVSNPEYSIFNWDAWGMYKPNGNNLLDGHRASPNGAEWSLKKIATPLGAEVNVEYERDTYSSISGYPLTTYININEMNNTITLPSDFAPVGAIGSTIKVAMHVIESNLTTGALPDNLFQAFTLAITGISGNIITTESIIDKANLKTFTNANGHKINRSHSNIFGDKDEIQSNAGIQRYGGDIRVSKISTKDENGVENATEYYYTKDGSKDGLTSGVCSVEPVMVQSGAKYDFYDHYDYPSMPIVYGKVTLSNTSNKKVTGEFSKKEMYEFITPSADLVDYQREVISENRVLALNYRFKINTDKIGNLTTHRRYSNSGQLLSEITFQYSDGSNLDRNIGTYAQSAFYCLRKLELGALVTQDLLYRTTKVYYPSILTSVTQKTNTQTITTTNKVWDYLTGAVLEKETTSSLGEKLLTVSKPAYKVAAYAGMGSKAYNINNKNMMVQEAQTYLYNVKADGTKQLLESQAQTWKNNWTYREFDPALYSYKDVLRNNEIWRSEKNYLWKSLLNGEAGTIAPGDFVDFNWLNPTGSDTRWQRTGAVTYYDHYSHALSTADINDNYSAVKLGYNNSQVIASASNSKYTEMTYSGAEDISPDTPNMFGGEVMYGTMRQTSAFPHTGKYSSLLPANGFGFTHRALFENGSLTPGRTYRASVWVHKTNTAGNNVMLYASMRTSSNGSLGYDTYAGVASSNTKRAGDWYLLSLDFTLPLTIPPTASYMEIAVSNLGNGGDAYADDFRFHPIDAPMQSYVYDNRGLLQATLDQENFATVYEYDNAGRIIATYREVENDGIRKVSEKKYNFARGN